MHFDQGEAKRTPSKARVTWVSCEQAWASKNASAHGPAHYLCLFDSESGL